MTAIESSLSAFLDSEFERQKAFLAELVRVPSDNPPGDCRAHAERSAELIEELGFEVERHAVPEEIVRRHGMTSVTNLVVRLRFGDGPVIALNAHGDVVPPGAGWTRDPYGAEIVDGWMYGRGAAVSKSDFATYVWAMLALKTLSPQLAGTIELHLTYDEESGGEVGPGWLLSEGITKPDYAIAAGFSYAVVTAHNGCLHLEVEVAGRSAHAAMPHTGTDALETATAILAALYEWRASLASRVSAFEGIGAPQMTIGLIEGGINTNVVPDRVTFRLDRRFTPEEDPVAVERELKEVIEKAASGSSAKVDVRQILLAQPLKPIGNTNRLSDVICAHASRVMGTEVKTKGVPLFTDARLYAERGIPIVLYGAGPRSIEEANAHRADERLPLSDLRKATEVMALVLAELLAADNGPLSKA